MWDAIVDSIGIYGFGPFIDIAFTMTGALIDGKVFGTVTGVKTADLVPSASPFLMQNYPNPFNPSTEIRFGLSRATVVRLTVANLLGQKVATLVDGSLEAGEHSVRWDAARLPTGTYYYTLQAGKYCYTRRMLVLR
jgi:hypothetical protein